MEHLNFNVPEDNADAQVDSTLNFFTSLYGEAAPGYLSLWDLPDKHTEWFPAHDLEAAAAYALRRSATHDIYFGVGVRREQLTHGRGERDDIIAIPALWVEVDLKHHVHTVSNLPTTIEEVRQLLEASIPLPLSLLIFSGHGVQGFWLWRELWTLDTEVERQAAARLLQRLHATVQAAAKLHNWHVDSVFDLARVLRIPATYNYKDPDNPIAVTILEFHPERRYNPIDFEPYLIEIQTNPGESRPGDLLPHDLPTIDINQLNISTRIKYIILDGEDRLNPSRHPSRSEAEWLVINAMIRAGYSDIEIAGVLLDARYGISGKPMGKGRQWVAQEISRARAKSGIHNNGNATAADDQESSSQYQAGGSTPPPQDDSPSTDESDQHRHLTDWGNAQRLTHRYGQDLHYLNAWAKWFNWTGQRWELDNALIVEVWAKKVIAELFRWASKQIRQMESKLASGDDSNHAELEKQLAHLVLALRWALKSESAPRIKAMIELAKSEPNITIVPEQLDADPWLLNCQNGVLDLRTGRIQPHHRRLLQTKICPVNYDPRAECPRWLKFLQEIMAGNEALISYLQRAIGYSLTGSVAEQCLFFLYGSGLNGKSTFLAIVLALLADYAMQTIPELLMVRSHEQHPTERADLFGKRLVATVEVEAGKRMAESLVKQLTGGDRIRARFMRQDFFEFAPTHKIWLAANHLPVITGTDHAVWRRIRLIPFRVRIPDDQVDKSLSAKLLEELPGILNWAVRGCLQWQEHNGLAEPKEISDATNSYREEMNLIGQFLQECCWLKPNDERVKARSGWLHDAYVKWSGEQITQKAFTARLSEMGYSKKRAGDGHVYWLGIGLIVGANRYDHNEGEKQES